MRYARIGTGIALVASAVVALTPRSAAAGCTQSAEAAAVKKSIQLAVKCNDRKLKSGPGVTCKQTPPPTCAGTLAGVAPSFGDAVALAYGPNNPPASGVDRKALKAQLSCQKAIGKA